MSLLLNTLTGMHKIHQTTVTDILKLGIPDRSSYDEAGYYNMGPEVHAIRTLEHSMNIIAELANIYQTYCRTSNR